MEITFLWDWFDFGFMLRFFKNTKHGNYHMSIDIQFGWLNIWVQLIKKK